MAGFPVQPPPPLADGRRIVPVGNLPQLARRRHCPKATWLKGLHHSPKEWNSEHIRSGRERRGVVARAGKCPLPWDIVAPLPERIKRREDGEGTDKDKSTGITCCPGCPTAERRPAGRFTTLSGRSPRPASVRTRAAGRARPRARACIGQFRRNRPATRPACSRCGRRARRCIRSDSLSAWRTSRTS